MWEQFEERCLSYLVETFKQNGIKFELLGSSNSKTSDIKVTPTDKEAFFFEVKKIPSQSSQFVVLPNLETKEFSYSINNKKPENIFHSEIIAHMQAYFEEYANAGTKGKAIILDEELFCNLIKDDYRAKNIKYIIFNEMKIIHVDDLDKFFDVSCCYRTKKSGSSSLTSAKYERIKLELAQDIRIKTIMYNTKKLFIESEEPLAKVKFSIDNLNLIFSQKAENKFEIRELSNTSNSNVIFSIKNKKEQPNALSLGKIFN